MGVEYNHLGEECESIKANHKRGICMGWDNDQRGEERDLGDSAAMEGEMWSVIGENLRWRVEDPSCQAGRVKSCVICTKIASIYCWFADSFPSSKFP